MLELNKCYVMLFRVLTPPAIFLYTFLLVHGFTQALEEGFFSLFVVEDLGLSHATYGKKHWI